MLGAIIGAGASLASSLFGNKSANKQAKQNMRHQKEFAQKGIQWKVKDAKAAGIHPLFALGAQTHSFSNVAGGNDYTGLAQAGQDIGRAIDATRNGKERVDAYTSELQKLQLQRGHMENQLLAIQIAKTKQAGHPPASPSPNNPHLIPGQGDSPGIENKAMERQGWDNANPHREAGAISEIGYSQSGTGYAPVFSKDFTDRSEDDIAAKIGWWMRNRVPQTFNITGSHKPPFPAPKGEYWMYHPYMQEYRLYKLADIPKFAKPRPKPLGKRWR